MKSRFFIEPKMLLRKGICGKSKKALNINEIHLFCRVFKDHISFNGFKGVFKGASKETPVNKIIIIIFYKGSLKVIKAFKVHFKDLFSSNSFKVYKASSGLLVSQN